MELSKYIDHTNLSSTAVQVDIKLLCKQAVKYNFTAVCVHPVWVSFAKQELKNTPIEIATVVGFPLGQNTTSTKLFETKEALENGADEIDMVINQSWVKEKKYNLITKEIKHLKEVCGTKILKVIIETCNLTCEEKRELCYCCNNAGADYIKTSTGFGVKGAQLEDIVLFKKYLNPTIKIKASGGIKTKEQAKQFINLGVERIGTSSGVALCTE